LSSTVLEVIGGSADKVAIFLGVAVVSNDTLDEAQWNGQGKSLGKRSPAANVVWCI
jgi:hypothetical protein